MVFDPGGKQIGPLHGLAAHEHLAPQRRHVGEVVFVERGSLPPAPRLVVLRGVLPALAALGVAAQLALVNDPLAGQRILLPLKEIFVVLVLEPDDGLQLLGGDVLGRVLLHRVDPRGRLVQAPVEHVVLVVGAGVLGRIRLALPLAVGHARRADVVAVDGPAQVFVLGPVAVGVLVVTLFVDGGVVEDVVGEVADLRTAQHLEHFNDVFGRVVEVLGLLDVAAEGVDSRSPHRIRGVVGTGLVFVLVPGIGLAGLVGEDRVHPLVLDVLHPLLSGLGVVGDVLLAELAVLDLGLVRPPLALVQIGQRVQVFVAVGRVAPVQLAESVERLLGDVGGLPVVLAVVGVLGVVAEHEIFGVVDVVAPVG